MSKRAVIFLISIAIAALGGFVAYREYANRGEDIAAMKINPSETLGAAALIADSDRDGLKDWEEELWRTDPLNPDTDKDGMGDAEEIKKGRNPLIAGPNDLLDSASIATKIAPPATTTLSDTERYARELFATYLSTQKEGTPLSQNDIDTIVNTVSASVPENSAKLLTEKDTETFNEETEGALRAYGNALGAALKKPWPSRENELTIFERAIQDTNPETARLDLANLIPIALAYENLGKTIASLSTPKNALAVHLRVANTALEIGEGIRGMSAALDDQIKTLASVARYLDAAPRLNESLTALRNFLETRGISFAEHEDGYMLWKATTNTTTP